jgi:apolipoprotein N-acyltransferase
VSALIDPTGDPQESLTSGETGYLVGELPLVGSRTVSTVIGAWPEAVMSLIALVGLVACAITGLRNRRRQGT